MSTTYPSMTSHYLTCTGPHGTHNMAYTHWGDPNNPQVLICLHGLTRNGRDFDMLAAALAAHYRVICPDVVGRGQSDWLSHPEEYTSEVYIADMITLLKHLNVSQVDWVGTSMGGLIGMILAAQSNSPIRRLVLNDIGPFIPEAGLKDLAQNLTQHPPYFETLSQIEQFFRAIYAQFGPLTDAQWQHLAQYSAQRTAEGYYRLAYDPNIITSFQSKTTDNVDLWSTWRAVHCPVLLLRGEQSTLLLKETVTQMQAIHPEMQVAEFPEIGHVPALMADDQIEVIQTWLL